MNFKRLCIYITLFAISISPVIANNNLPVEAKISCNVLEGFGDSDVKEYTTEDAINHTANIITSSKYYYQAVYEAIKARSTDNNPDFKLDKTNIEIFTGDQLFTFGPEENAASNFIKNLINEMLDEHFKLYKFNEVQSYNLIKELEISVKDYNLLKVFLNEIKSNENIMNDFIKSIMLHYASEGNQSVYNKHLKPLLRKDNPTSLKLRNTIMKALKREDNIDAILLPENTGLTREDRLQMDLDIHRDIQHKLSNEHEKVKVHDSKIHADEAAFRTWTITRHKYFQKYFIKLLYRTKKILIQNPDLDIFTLNTLLYETLPLYSHYRHKFSPLKYPARNILGVVVLWGIHKAIISATRGLLLFDDYTRLTRTVLEHIFRNGNLRPEHQKEIMELLRQNSPNKARTTKQIQRYLIK